MVSFGNKMHVVAFDIPYPANYGGVIDIFYKIKALHKEGVSVTLHCYQYGRQESAELERYCHKVYYYRRKVFKNPFLTRKPYIVASRNSSALIENLLKDDAPILFEGLHSTFYLDDFQLADRLKIVRTHNVEHDYYRKLEEVEANYFKKYFFRVEAEKLEKYEQILNHANFIAAISPKDTDYFSKKYHNAFFLPPFHANSRVFSKTGKGDFVLYHGNLSVGENIEAAKYLIRNVFAYTDIPFVIAGSNPPADLVEEAAQYGNISIKSNISSQRINRLMEDAQINVLHTAQDTGIKLKLINALYRGRFCVANADMVGQTGLEALCHQADKPKEYLRVIKELWSKPFTAKQVEKRKVALHNLYNNRDSVRKLLTVLIHHHVPEEGAVSVEDLIKV